MNKLFTLAFVMLISMTSITAVAQSEDGALTKKQLRKKLEAVKDSISYVNAVAALNSSDFVASADYLILRRGRAVVVSPTTNFVSLSGEEAVIQVTPYNSGPGLNGIGGITLRGKVFSTKMRTDKKGNVYFSMDVLGAGISAMIEISLDKGSNRVSVDIAPNTRGGRITLRGYLAPSEESDVYKAMPMF